MPVAILDDCYRMESSWFTQGHPLRGLGSAGVIPGMFCIGKPGELLVCLGLTPPSYGVSLLQGLLSWAFVNLGAHDTKLWSVAPPGLWGSSLLTRVFARLRIAANPRYTISPTRGLVIGINRFIR